jgi:hypothetical protein
VYTYVNLIKCSMRIVFDLKSHFTPREDTGKISLSSYSTSCTVCHKAPPRPPHQADTPTLSSIVFLRKKRMNGSKIRLFQATHTAISCSPLARNSIQLRRSRHLAGSAFPCILTARLLVIHCFRHVMCRQSVI